MRVVGFARKMPGPPHPPFFVSVDSKQFNYPVSCLDATLAERFVSVDSKWLASKHNCGSKFVSTIGTGGVKERILQSA